MRNFTVEILVGHIGLGRVTKTKKHEFKDNFVKQIRFRKNRRAGLFQKRTLSTACNRK